MVSRMPRCLPVCLSSLFLLTMVGCGDDDETPPSDPVEVPGQPTDLPNQPPDPPEQPTDPVEPTEPTEPVEPPVTPALAKPYSGYEATWLDQSWSENERHDFYYVTQGSQLVPYAWFLALEQADNETPFRDDAHMASLGYITQAPEPRRNPDGLPIGFVNDDNPDNVSITMQLRRAFVGAEYDAEHFPLTNSWLGLTCAACHTADLTYQGQVIRVDGGAAMSDHQSFLAELARSLETTLAEDEKFKRFERRISNDGNNDTTGLRDEVTGFSGVMRRLVDQNASDVAYGFARLDAFGAILNRVCESGLEIPANHGVSDAPVSYPFLWDAPKLDWVQWNSVADNPIARNVGEVLGVYAHFQLTGTPQTGQFNSTARIDRLFRLEQLLTTLEAPAWPADLFGEIDQDKAGRGQALFAKHCAACHGVRDADGNFPMTEPGEAPFNKTFIKTVSVPAQQIGTDPKMIQNFLTRFVDPGVLGPLVKPQVDAINAQRAAAGQPPLPGAPAALVLAAAVRAVIKTKIAQDFPNIDDEMQLELTGYRNPKSSPPFRGAGYKARPLNGVWATAPFLHNGSVPSLYQLLLPDDQRAKTFHVGSREFDPVNVGLNTEPAEGSYKFETADATGNPIPGNWNGGHSGHDHTQTQTADGEWRDFTDEQRWDLIEYMKTLK